MLGSAIWEVRKEYDKIYYAMEFNPKHNSLVSGADIKSISQNPTLLITDCYMWSKVDGESENPRRPSPPKEIYDDV